MRAVSRGALASVCWHCSMQSDGTAVLMIVTNEKTYGIIKINRIMCYHYLKVISSLNTAIAYLSVIPAI